MCIKKTKKESIHLQRFAELQDVWEMLAQKNLPVRNLVDYGGPMVRGGIFDTLEAVDRNVFITLLEARWELLKELRSAVLKALEEKREQGEIKHSLDSRVTMYVAGEAKEVLDDLFAGQTLFEDDLVSFLKEYLIVSQVELVPNSTGLQQTALEGLLVRVDKARGEKCPRCWNWDENNNPDHLCKRCEAVLSASK